jgi:ABC-type multidrug transport system, ATPase component
MIEINNLTKIYSSSGLKAVDNVSFTVNGGEIFGFLGPNGAGKSTTIKCLTGILRPTSGNIRINGVDMGEDPVKAKGMIGYVPDEHTVYEGLTGRQYINFIANVFDVPAEKRKERIEKYGALFGLKDRLDEAIQSYSHGMKQKTSVIAALVHEPDIFVLDEPMTGLDPQSSYELKKIMAEMAAAGRTVFFSSHVLEVVEKICTRVAIISKGALVAVCDMKELKERRADLSLEKFFLEVTAPGENL